MGQRPSTPTRTASKQSPTFTCFSRLPKKIRLKIWEAALPQHRDFNAGYLLTPSKGPRGKNRVPKKKVPLRLLGSCRESRSVALESGSFMPFEGLAWLKREMLWVDKRIKTIIMPCDPTTLGRLSKIPSNIEAIADIPFSMQGFEDLRKRLTRRLPGTSSCTIKTVYLVLYTVPLAYSQGRSTKHYPCLDSDSAVIGLEDERLPTYMTSAIKVHVEQTLHGSYPDAFYRTWAENIMTELQDRWQFGHIEQRSAWDPDHGVELKPAVVFGKFTSLGCSYRLRALHDLFFMDSFIPSESHSPWIYWLPSRIMQGRLFWDAVLPGLSGIYGTRMNSLLES